jgi:hypothetical protein
MSNLKERLADMSVLSQSRTPADALKYIEELEANLAKAMKTLEFYADGEWPQDYPGGVLYASGDDTTEFKTHLDYGDKARTTLAELKGEK